MAIALRGTPTTGVAASGNNLVINVPAGVVSGDVLLWNIGISGASHVPATPTGLTLLDSGAVGPSAATYWRLCDGTEGASFTFATSGLSAASAGTCRAYSGVASVSSINAHSAQNRSTTTSAIATGVTTTVNNCMLVFSSSNGTGSASFTNPTGFLNQSFVNQSLATAVSCDLSQTTAGATGNETGTWPGAVNNYASLVALAPPGASAPTNTVSPAVTGTAQVGQTLSTTNGTWTDDGSPTFTYQWQRDVAGNGVFSNITLNATGSTYVLVAADQSNNVRCVVTDNTPDGNTPANSNSVGPVSAAPTGGSLPDMAAFLAAKVI